MRKELYKAKVHCSVGSPGLLRKPHLQAPGEQEPLKTDSGSGELSNAPASTINLTYRNSSSQLFMKSDFEKNVLHTLEKRGE